MMLTLCAVLAGRNRFLLKSIQRARKGRRKMPEEMIREWIGKVCAISMFNDLSGTTGRIVAVEHNWIKLEEKHTSRLINGDMIRDIRLLPEKYQK